MGNKKISRITNKRLYLSGGKIMDMASTGLSIMGDAVQQGQIKDTSSLENQIEQKAQEKVTANSYDDLLSEWGSYEDMQHVSYKDLLNGSGGDAAMGAFNSSMQGASAGLSAGPWGAVAGGVIGGLASGIGRIFARKRAKKKANSLNAAIDEANARNLANFQNRADNLENQADLNVLANLSALGGKLNNNLSDYSNGVTIIGNGGTHEDNPNDGVQIGVDNQGIPNLVEEGEVIYDDYVFSNRMYADKDLLDKFNLPKSYKGYSFAAIAEKLSKESEERPNDPISKRGLSSSMQRLQGSQEAVRLRDYNSQEGTYYAYGGRKGNMYRGTGNKSNFLQFYTPEEKFINNLQKSSNLPTYELTPPRQQLTYNDVMGLKFDSPSLINVSTPEEAYANSIFKPFETTKSEESSKIKADSSGSGKFGRSKTSWLRYAPVAGATIGLAKDLFSKPDYSNADEILEAADQAGSYSPINYDPIGNYLQYKPFDRNFYINKLNSQAESTRRAIMNTTSPSRNAALLAADYNAQGRLGDLARQAEEYNLAQRQAVETFNRGTNMTNSEMGIKAAMANQEAALKAGNSRLSGVMQAMSMRDAIDARRAASMSANLTNLFDSLGDIGREEYSRNMINSNPALYYLLSNSGNVSHKNRRGGYLTIRKKK